VLPTLGLYVERILDLYRRTPGTSGNVRRADRRLAVALYDRQIPLEIFANALLVATARRTFRPDGSRRCARSPPSTTSSLSSTNSSPPPSPPTVSTTSATASPPSTINYRDHRAIK
jgi:hypothetical protein